MARSFRVKMVCWTHASPLVQKPTKNREEYLKQTLWVYEDGGGGEIGKGILKLGGVGELVLT